MLHTIALPVGQLQSNCYLVYSKRRDSRSAVPTIIIDPGDDADLIIQTVQEKQLNPVAMITTHGHFDHVMAAFELQQAYGIPFYLHPKDRFLLERLSQTASHFLGKKVVAIPPQEISDITVVTSRDLSLHMGLHVECIETPGHTPGSVAIYFPEENTVFVGDLMFAGGGYGRTDFSYCSKDDLHTSIQKILQLPSQTTMYCGHGQETSVASEKRFY